MGRTLRRNLKNFQYGPRIIYLIRKWKRITWKLQQERERERLAKAEAVMRVKAKKNEPEIEYIVFPPGVSWADWMSDDEEKEEEEELPKINAWVKPLPVMDLIVKIPSSSKIYSPSPKLISPIADYLYKNR